MSTLAPLPLSLDDKPGQGTNLGHVLPTLHQHTMSTSPIAYVADDAIKATASTSGAASLGLAELEAQARPGQNPYAVVGARTAPKSLGAGVSDSLL